MADNDYALGRVVERIAHGQSRGFDTDLRHRGRRAERRRPCRCAAQRRARRRSLCPARHALVSTRYTTVNVLRTIEAVLGLKPLGLNDALAAPMADLFDPAQAQLELSRRGGRCPAFDQAADSGAPLRRRRRARLAGLPDEKRGLLGGGDEGPGFQQGGPARYAALQFCALWRGLGKGPEPQVRDAQDLRKDRPSLLSEVENRPCAKVSQKPH